MNGLSLLIDAVRADARLPLVEESVAPLREDPCLVFSPLGIEPDQWQRAVMVSKAQRQLLLCSRQSGKSTILSGMALQEALVNPFAEVLIISKTLRQSLELMRKVKELWRAITGGRVNRRRGWNPVVGSLQAEAAVTIQLVQAKGWDGAALVGDDFQGEVNNKQLSLECPNGARILALPGNPDNLVSFSSVTLLIIDEASRVPDALYAAIRPFLAVTEATHGRRGRLVVASTPFGRRGWFYEEVQKHKRAGEAYRDGVQFRGANTGGARSDDGAGEGAGVPTWYPDRLRQAPKTPQEAQAAARYSGEEAAKLRRHFLDGASGRPFAPQFAVSEVTALQCSRLDQEFLRDEREALGERWYNQEYMIQFVDSVDSVFSHDLIDAMVQPRGGGAFQPWFE